MIERETEGESCESTAKRKVGVCSGAESLLFVGGSKTGGEGGGGGGAGCGGS